MSMPAIPTDALQFLSEVNNNPWSSNSNPFGMAKGGHRQNWVQAMQDMAAAGNWMGALGVFLSALADQVSIDAASAAAGSGTEATAADIAAGLSARFLSIRGVYASGVPVALTDAPTIAWDMSASGGNYTVTLGAADRILANPTHQVAGKGGVLIIKQDATGGRKIATWPSNITWIGGQPFWPTAPNARSLISYLVLSPGDILATFAGNS